jgi:lathosterol oxidase
MWWYDAVPGFIGMEEWLLDQGYPSPRGLLTGLLSVLIFQIIVFAYYFVVRMFIKPKTIQYKPPPNSTLIDDLWAHVSAPESFLMVFGYLTVTWMFRLNPASYYDVESPINWAHVIIQLLVVDFFTFVDHLIEHNWPALYKRSHKFHHVFRNPKLYNAFNGSVLDTLSLILIPLFCTLQVCRFVTCWSFVGFGTLYATQFTLIHCEFSHPWDYILIKLGVGTAWDHNVHHRLFVYNYGHFFMYYDWLWGSWKDPREVKHLRISGMGEKSE